MARFFILGVHPISKAQVDAAITLYDRHAARGLEPNAIADLVGWTRGTATVVRRWSMERAAGLEVRP